MFCLPKLLPFTLAVLTAVLQRLLRRSGVLIFTAENLNVEYYRV